MNTSGGTETGDRARSIRHLFRCLDRDHKGSLTEDDLVQGFKKFYGDKKNPVDDEMLRKAFLNMDIAANNIIDYSDFLAASIGQAIIADEHSISAAFRGLDMTNKGSVTMEDLTQAMGSTPARMFCEAHEAEVFSYVDFRKAVQ